MDEEAKSKIAAAEIAAEKAPAVNPDLVLPPMGVACPICQMTSTNGDRHSEGCPASDMGPDFMRLPSEQWTAEVSARVSARLAAREEPQDHYIIVDLMY